MPVPTPFHPRTSALCTSLFWKEWAGCHAVRSYDTCHEREYFALRHSVGLIDVTPLFKYEVRGKDAGRFLARVMVKDVQKLRVGRVTYLCWCDDDGKVVDDGTVTRLDESHYRVTAAEPALAWLRDLSRGYDVTVEDSSRRLAALALQGPRSRDVLARASDAPVDTLRFFRASRARLGTAEVVVTRTGYTGDLGYEIWVDASDALGVWDAIVDAGRDFRLAPVGLDALDVARVEAGFVMNGVDYYSANHCLIESRKSSPWEIGLGRTVQLDREPFVGRAALCRERERGTSTALVGLEYDWDEIAAVYDEVGLPPQLPSGAWRAAVPVYDGRGRQIGRATSGAWSPTLKRNLALASVEARFGRRGTIVKVEITAEYRRRRVSALVARTPFFDPPRKRA